MPKFPSQIEIIHQLTEAGFTQKQAEVQAKIVTDVREQNLSTKEDLKQVDFSTERNFSKLKKKIDNMAQELKNDNKIIRKEIELLESKISSKIFVIMSSLLGAFTIVQKYLLP